MWGQPFLAPADATVAAAVDDLRDNKPHVQTDAAHPAGNHVILDFGNGEFALLAHLQKGSVKVKAGDRVQTGQQLGLCGNSGNTSEPHLHFHLQDRAELFGQSRGLPFDFFNYKTNGVPVERGRPVQGEFIEATK